MIIRVHQGGHCQLPESDSEYSRAKRDGPDGWRIGAQPDPGNVPGANRGGWDGV